MLFFSSSHLSPCFSFIPCGCSTSKPISILNMKRMELSKQIYNTITSLTVREFKWHTQSSFTFNEREKKKEITTGRMLTINVILRMYRCMLLYSHTQHINISFSPVRFSVLMFSFVSFSFLSSSFRLYLFYIRCVSHFFSLVSLSSSLDSFCFLLVCRYALRCV